MTNWVFWSKLVVVALCVVAWGEAGGTGGCGCVGLLFPRIHEVCILGPLARGPVGIRSDRSPPQSESRYFAVLATVTISEMVESPAQSGRRRHEPESPETKGRWTRTPSPSGQKSRGRRPL